MAPVVQDLEGQLLQTSRRFLLAVQDREGLYRRNEEQKIWTFSSVTKP